MLALRVKNDLKGEYKQCRGLTALKYAGLLAEQCTPCWDDVDEVDAIFQREVSLACKAKEGIKLKSVGGMCHIDRFDKKTDHCCSDHKTLVVAPNKRMHYCFHPKCKRFRHENRFYAEYHLHRTCIHGIEHAQEMPRAIKEARGLLPPPAPPKQKRRKMADTDGATAAPTKRARKATLTRPLGLLDLPLPEDFLVSSAADGPESPHALLAAALLPPPSSGMSTVATELVTDPTAAEDNAESQWDFFARLESELESEVPEESEECEVPMLPMPPIEPAVPTEPTESLYDFLSLESEVSPMPPPMPPIEVAAPTEPTESLDDFLSLFLEVAE